MYRQIFIPNEQNYLVSIPSYLYGHEVEVLVLPINEAIILSKIKPRDNIVPLASTLRNYPFRVQCVVTGKKGELAIDQIRTVDKTRLDTSNSFGQLSESIVYGDSIIGVYSVL